MDVFYQVPIDNDSTLTEQKRKFSHPNRVREDSCLFVLLVLRVSYRVSRPFHHGPQPRPLCPSLAYSDACLSHPNRVRAAWMSMSREVRDNLTLRQRPLT